MGALQLGGTTRICPSVRCPGRFFAFTLFNLPSRLRLLALLCGLLVPANLWAGFYFLQSGPPPLRFIEAAKTNIYLWPPQSPAEKSAGGSNHLEHASAGPSQSNAGTSLNPGGNSSTDANGVTASAVTAPMEMTDLSSSNALINLGANPPSARELLVVTPQMLAEYLRSAPGAANRPATNAVANGEVPFTPPTPRVVPSSEAIYRTQ
jgi:hypothetical protein